MRERERECERERREKVREENGWMCKGKKPSKISLLLLIFFPLEFYMNAENMDKDETISI